MQPRILIAAAGIAVALSACGGGGGGGGDSPAASSAASVPASALQSVDSFVAFLRGLASDETSEPLTLPAGGTAPTSETADPA